MAYLIDLTGWTFGSWYVIEQAYSRQKTVWKCQCVCGIVRVVAAESLRSGRSRSCGCIGFEVMRRKITQHGQATVGHITPEWRAYSEARRRCTNEKTQYYRHYGGRGIKFLFNNFIEFFNDVGPKPAPHLSLDRIDNDDHYRPGNIRWATRSEQQRNTRRYRLRHHQEGA